MRLSPLFSLRSTICGGIFDLSPTVLSRLSALSAEMERGLPIFWRELINSIVFLAFVGKNRVPCCGRCDLYAAFDCRVVECSIDFFLYTYFWNVYLFWIMERNWVVVCNMNRILYTFLCKKTNSDCENLQLLNLSFPVQIYFNWLPVCCVDLRKYSDFNLVIYVRNKAIKISL